MEIVYAGVAGLGIGVGLIIGVLAYRRLLAWLERDDAGNHGE